jgi:branched-chain amino acid transport system substrate-binding protein
VTRALVLLAVACGACRPAAGGCAVVALVGGTPHSVEGVVAESVLAGRGHSDRVCIEIARHRSYDDVGAPAAEVALAQRIAAEDDVMVVVGHATSRGSLEAAPVYRNAGLAQLVPTGTSRRLRDAGPSVFLLVPDDSAEGDAMAAYGASGGFRRALVFYAADEYGEGLRDGLRVALARRGLSVSAAVPLVDGSDVATLARAALRNGPVDVAYILGSYRIAGDVARELHRLAPALALVGSDAALYPQGLAERAGSALDVLRLVSFRRPDPLRPGAAEYLRAFRAVAGRDPTPDEAVTHDALMLAIAALDSAGADRAAVRDWLASLGAARPPWQGVTGPIQFAHPGGGEFTVLRIENGHAVPVTPR